MCAPADEVVANVYGAKTGLSEGTIAVEGGGQLAIGGCLETYILVLTPSDESAFYE